jgi:translation initiation factor 1 (eIF-1/SUI1)|tara:strand:+ start:278 stop:454 length:177 start_codon:yes stop_codon:yes gene_type:complete
MAKDEKELQREKIAEDIKKYLARGGAVKSYAVGQSGVADPLTEGWGLKPKVIRNKKGN